MATTTHTRSVHIDAPVEEVFDYVKDPQHFFAVMSKVSSGLADRVKGGITDVEMTPEGVGSTYKFRGELFVFHLDVVLTREEFVPNERIVDHSNYGVTWASTFEPDETGTTYTLSCGVHSKVPLLDKLEDMTWKGDQDLDMMLDDFKQAIES